MMVCLAAASPLATADEPVGPGHSVLAVGGDGRALVMVLERSAAGDGAGDRWALYRSGESQQQWSPWGGYLRPPARLGWLAEQALVLSADGTELVLLWPGGGSSVALPAGRVVDVTSESGTLWALVRGGGTFHVEPAAPARRAPLRREIGLGRRPTTATAPSAAPEPDDQPTTEPAAATPSESASWPDGLYLLRRPAARWEVVRQLPEVFVGSARLSLAIHEGRPIVAGVHPNGAIRVWFAPAVEATTQPADPPLPDERLRVLAPVGAVTHLRVLPRAKGPLLWLTDGPSAGWVYRLDGTGAAVPLDMGPSRPEVDQLDMAAVGDELHLFALDGQRRLWVQRFDATGRALAPAGRVPLPAAAPSAQVRFWVNTVVLVAMVVAMFGALRRRPQMQASMLRVQELRLAPINRRLAAGLIDLWPLLGGLAVAVMLVPADATAADILGDGRLDVLAIVSLALWVSASAVGELLGRRSLGKMLLGLEVSDLAGGAPTTAAVLLRNALRVVDAFVWFIPLAMILLSPLRQRIGDIAAGTLVTVRPAARREGPPQVSQQTFPKPSPERFLAEYKVFSPAGDPLGRPSEDFAAAQKRVQADAAWGRWLAGQRAAVDAWMQKREDRVEWITGWWHDYVSPNDGSRLIYTPDAPAVGGFLSSPSDPKVEVTQKIFDAWVFQFRSQHGQMMANAAQLYRLTGEQRYAEWAAGQIDFYADHFQRWPLRERGQRGQPSYGASRIYWQSLDEATSVCRNITVARTLDDFVSPRRREHWGRELFRPQVELLRAGFARIHNIACWHRSAEAHVALYFGDDELWRASLSGPFGLRAQLARGVTSDYLWVEQSLGYNSYVVSAVYPLLHYASVAGRLEELRPEALVLQNLLLSPLALRFADGRLPTPADSGRQRAPNLAALAGVYRLFPTTLGLSEASKRRSWDTLLDPPAEPAGEVALAPVVSRSFESSRMALLRQGRWQVFFHYGQLDVSHAQAEALNYEAAFDDIDVTHDAGTVGYGSPLHAGYYRLGIAHNAPLVDGGGQASWQPGRLLGFDARKAEVAAEQPDYAPGVSARRTLRIAGEGARLEDEVTVRLRDGVWRRLGLVCHVQGVPQLGENFVPDAEWATGRPAEFAHWRGVRLARFHDKAGPFEVRFGQRSLMLEFATEGAFALVVADAPDSPPGRRAVFYLEVGAAEATFRTVIYPPAEGR